MTTEQPLMTTEQPLMTTEHPLMTAEQPLMINPPLNFPLDVDCNIAPAPVTRLTTPQLVVRG